MDIFTSRFYRINAILLASVGLWPYQEFNKQRIQQVLFHISIFTVILSQGIRMMEVWGDMDIMIECLTPIGVQVSACLKSINSIINRDKMTKLLEMMKLDWSNLRKAEEIELLKRYAEQGRIITLLYVGYMFSTMTIYLSIPLGPRVLDVLMPRNESRPPTYLYETQYYVDPEEYFIPIMLHTYTGTIITVTTIIAADSMYATYVQHACGILAVIGHRLENLSKNYDNDCDANISKDKDRCYHELVQCIQGHNNAIEFADLLASSYSTVCLLQIGLCVIELSISGVQVLIKLGQYDEMIRLGQFTVAQLSHLFYNSWPGQKLIDQSISFRDSVYVAEWYSFSLRSRRLLKIVMLRAMIPHKITAGNICDMSMESFGSVVQTSVSYFTVFASLR